MTALFNPALVKTRRQLQKLAEVARLSVEEEREFSEWYHRRGVADGRMPVFGDTSWEE